MITLYYRLLSWIWKLRNGSIERKNAEKIKIGRLQPLEAMYFKRGNRVLTTTGIGTITELDRDDLNNIPIYIVSVRGGSEYARFKEVDLMQFFIYHDKLKIYIPLSFSNYTTVKRWRKNAIVQYRITKRGFAKLIE